MDFTTFFAIIFIVGIHETRLKIPSNVFFVPQKFVTLRDRHRNRWRIKAREIDGSWYLLDGWAKFVTDCSIDTMDVLNFTQSGPGLYDVNILGSGGQMREGVGYHMTNVEPENENVDTFERVSSGNNNEGGSRKPHKKKRIVDYLSQGILIKGSKPVNIPESDNNGKRIIILSSDENSECRTCDSYDETFEEDFKSGNGRTKRSKSKMRDVTTRKSRIRVDPFGKKLFTIGGIPKPDNKYFVTRVQPKRRSELYIPKEILNDKDLKIPSKIKLVDTKGNTYTSYKALWKGDRTFYKGGWNRLGRRNHLRDNDICICEFGVGDKTGYLFISFLRFTE